MPAPAITPATNLARNGDPRVIWPEKSVSPRNRGRPGRRSLKLSRSGLPLLASCDAAVGHALLPWPPEVVMGARARPHRIDLRGTREASAIGRSLLPGRDVGEAGA